MEADFENSGDDALAELRQTNLLLRRHYEGDRAAYDELFARHAAAVRRSIAARLGSQLCDIVQIDDVLQEAFLRAWQYLESEHVTSASSIASFRGLVVRIALRAVQDLGRYGKRAKRAQDQTVPLDAVGREPSDHGPRPSEGLQLQELEERTELAFLSLRERDRLVIDCLDNLAMSYSEAAEELGCSVPNARLRYHRAKERWAEALRKLSG